LKAAGSHPGEHAVERFDVAVRLRNDPTLLSGRKFRKARDVLEHGEAQVVMAP
jgi:hypothetical protein